MRFEARTCPRVLHPGQYRNHTEACFGTLLMLDINFSWKCGGERFQLLRSFSVGQTDSLKFSSAPRSNDWRHEGLAGMSWSSDVLPPGGVVIMVRRGLTISDFHEEIYAAHDFEDGMSQKARIPIRRLATIRASSVNFSEPFQPCVTCEGFMRVRVQHPSVGDVWVIGTHTQAWPKNAAIRLKQSGPHLLSQPHALSSECLSLHAHVAEGDQTALKVEAALEPYHDERPERCTCGACRRHEHRDVGDSSNEDGRVATMLSARSESPAFWSQCQTWL